MSIFSKVIKTVFGTKSSKDLKLLYPYIDKINSTYEALNSLSDEELKNRFVTIKNDFHNLIESKKEEFSKDGINSEIVDDNLYEIEKEYLNDNMVEVFAIVKDVSRRLCNKKYSVMGQEIEWNMIPYDVQLIGGIVLHQGKIAEMKTGEGKTLVSTLAIVLNALTGRGLHVITVNDYLAERDSQWMGILYNFLGLSVGCILNQMDPIRRREMYQCDITYGTNSQFGFDYLRDNMANTADHQVQRSHAYAIVDEVDSVLIDEARTPLIISGQVESQRDEQYTTWKSIVESLIKQQRNYINDMLSNIDSLLEDDRNEAGKIMLLAQRGTPKNRKLLKLYQQQGIKQLINQVESEYIREKKLHELDEELYFSIDEKSNIIDLSDKGREYLSPENPENFVIPDLGETFHSIEKKLSDKNQIALEKEKVQAVHSERGERIHAINQLLRAYSLFEKDNEYIVQDGKVLIVDQHTGRVMHGRQFSDGMHQAIEAKENVTIQRETQTVATITIQNYFRMYEKLSGMTGTALTESAEFMQIYKLDVVEIPTNQGIQRIDHEDLIYKTKKEKYQAIISKITELYQRGQPVLVGTTSVEESEVLAKLLKSTKLPHNVLNAKQHQSEAEIVARAGLKNSITISTNMAGRGTDIKLGDGVLDLGGLFILGTGRHESRRIDLQLRGRAGRQGDPGSSVFYLSLEDDLMRLFNSDRIASIMDRLGVEEGEVITAGMVTKSIERAQKKVEGRNFSIRKRLLEYDDVMNQQREVVYNRRNEALHGTNIKKEIFNIQEDYIDVFLDNIGDSEEDSQEWNWDYIESELTSIFTLELNEEIRNSSNKTELKKIITENIEKIYDLRESFVPSDVMRGFERYVTLRTIDEMWRDHLYAMDQLREGINLRAYGQKDPLLEYKSEGFDLFVNFIDEVNKNTIQRLFRTRLHGMDQAPKITNNPKIKTLDSKKSQSSIDGMIVRQKNHSNNVNNSQNQKDVPVKVEKKLGRNDKIKISNGKETKELKWKKAKPLIESGKWSKV